MNVVIPPLPASAGSRTGVAVTPPWVVGLASQVAATRALQSPEYYEARWAETHRLRDDLIVGLGDLGWDAIPGCANFLLAHLPDQGSNSTEVLERARHLRDVASMGASMGDRAVRVAVKDAETNQMMISILSQST